MHEYEPLNEAGQIKLDAPRWISYQPFGAEPIGVWLVSVDRARNVAVVKFHARKGARTKAVKLSDLVEREHKQ